MRWIRYVFPILLAVSLLSYLPSIGAGFVFDFLGWQQAYEKGTFADIIHCFGYNGNHQLLHLVFYSLYELFFIDGLPWYLVFCTLHGINGYLLYRLMLRLAAQWQFTITPLFAFLGAVLFLLHPYNVEVVVWKVCVHYLMSLMAVLLILLLFLSYLNSGRKKFLVWGIITFILSLFALEIAFATPIVLTLAAVITWFLSGKKKEVFRAYALFGGGLWISVGAYLLLNKLTLGNIIGHYGGVVHLQFDLLAMMATEVKYLVKHLLYARFYSFTTKGVLFDKWLSYPEVTFFWLSFFIALAIIYFVRIKKVAQKWHGAFFGLFGSMLFVLPIANMFFFHLHIGMNDRYCYIPLAFLTIGFISLLGSVKKWIAFTWIGIIFALNIFFQQKTLTYWRQSTRILESLKADFRWHDAPYVFVLNSPDNLKGIWMTSIVQAPSGVDELIDFQTERPYDGTMFDVFQYNMTNPENSARVEQTGPMQIKVTLNQWGNWWHLSGIGASNYENEFYKAELLDYPYLLTFKKFPPGSVIIYQVGDKWEEFQMTLN